MGRKSKIEYELKVLAVRNYLNGVKSMKAICEELSVARSSVRQWVSLYRSKGSIGLLPQRKHVSYSKELKTEAVKDYLTGKGSAIEISMKYGLRSQRQLLEWTMKYNGHEEMKPSGTGGYQTMTKGRATTLEDRIEIVNDCIKNDKNYSKTAEKYQVSYQQVRNWMMKYEKSGVNGLLDRRGKRKPASQLTETEKLKAENKLLEAKNKRLEMENELLKKLEKIERGWE
ncbi:helix-turn-helix domain-containing protein [Chengkuizengella sediminis]|uniref:helix-turn-helix domain-containing protein n=1 Tax=Chengkuizengella sediminis TaxID=1885917 RepID=UPI00138A38F4|nr:helix-turn-helix domain-containing protein [Chengkuizengella sediminis]NDI37220.1 transposase [Chengkuizengella sediminis]